MKTNLLNKMDWKTQNFNDLNFSLYLVEEVLDMILDISDIKLWNSMLTKEKSNNHCFCVGGSAHSCYIHNFQILDKAEQLEEIEQLLF